MAAYDVEVNGHTRHLAVTRIGCDFIVSVDNRSFDVSVARVDAQTWSLLVRSAADAYAPRRSFEVSLVPESASGRLAVRIGGTLVTVAMNGRRSPDRQDGRAPLTSGPQRVVAPMPGKVVRVLVQSGEAVRPRQPLVVVEAMKMENELRALRAGTVAEVHAQEGLSVDAGALLVVIQ